MHRLLLLIAFGAGSVNATPPVACYDCIEVNVVLDEDHNHRLTQLVFMDFQRTIDSKTGNPTRTLVTEAWVLMSGSMRKDNAKHRAAWQAWVDRQLRGLDPLDKALESSRYVYAGVLDKFHRLYPRKTQDGFWTVYLTNRDNRCNGSVIVKAKRMVITEGIDTERYHSKRFQWHARRGLPYTAR